MKIRHCILTRPELIDALAHGDSLRRTARRLGLCDGTHLRKQMKRLGVRRSVGPAGVVCIEVR